MNPTLVLAVFLAFSAIVLGTAAILLPRRIGLMVCAAMAVLGAGMAVTGSMLETESWRFANPGEDMHPFMLFGAIIGLAGVAGLPAVWIAKHYFPPVTSGTAMAVLLGLFWVPALIWIFVPMIFPG